MPARLILLALLLLAAPAGARTLTVGPGQEFAGPGAAARQAQDGDTVLIQPGQFYDCAVWPQHRLLIAGTGPGVVITDTTCQGKATFVITGDGVTVRDLTLARARVADGNGAGIRLEGQGLTLQQVRFVNDQVGLLSGTTGPGAIRIADCTFQGGGVGGERPLYAVMAGATALLQIEDSTFHAIKGGQISSAAARTELTRNRIDTGTGDAPAVAVLATGGDLVMTDNELSVGPNTPRPAAAILATGQGRLTLSRNRLDNQTGFELPLLLDWTGRDPVLQDNRVPPGDAVLSTSGLWHNRASSALHATKDQLRALAGQLKHDLQAAARP